MYYHHDQISPNSSRKAETVFQPNLYYCMLHVATKVAKFQKSFQGRYLPIDPEKAPKPNHPLTLHLK